LLIGLATLAKIYPLLFLVVVLRRRDWTLLLACLATILLGYLPYLILGHGQVLGFFSTYADEHSRNSGLVPHIMTWINLHTGLFNSTTEHIIEALLLGGTALSILHFRWRERLSMEAALLILLGTTFAISPHIFPWYTTALLPWVAVCLQPLWTRGTGLKPAGLAIAMAWYFPCIIVIHYLFDHEPDWTVYYLIVYDVVLAGVCIAACVGILHSLSQHIHSAANISWRWLPQSEKLWPGKRDKR
ncbi:MAG: DUF2029 domain-containing protein, partial [Ktedonobacteraceae bacterium]|nr:DUF2029 domain-containing protein [Ktedonobacteraceae bacterium]